MYEAHIVIAANGDNSGIRGQVQPDFRREDPGYVLLRGTELTKDLSNALLDKVEGGVVHYRMRYSYSIM